MVCQCGSLNRFDWFYLLLHYYVHLSIQEISIIIQVSSPTVIYLRLFSIEDGTTQWTFPTEPAPSSINGDLSECQLTEPSAVSPPSRIRMPPSSSMSQSTSSLHINSPDPNYTAQFINVLLFPFRGVVPLIIYLSIRLLLALLELVCGFLTLGYTTIRNCLLNKHSKLFPVSPPYFLLLFTDIFTSSFVILVCQIWMIVDGFIILVDLCTHIALLYKPAHLLHQNKHPLPSLQQFSLYPNRTARALWPTHVQSRYLFVARAIIVYILRAFQLVWSILGTVTLANDVYVVCLSLSVFFHPASYM